MSVYYDATPKGKFGLLPDGTLGYPSKPDFSAITIQRDNLPPIRAFDTHISPYNLPDYVDSVSHIDWFRATAVGADILFSVEELCDMLSIGDDGEIDTDIACQHVTKGLHGYPEQYIINVNTDRGSMAVGAIAYESNPNNPMCGVMFDLGGKGLDYLRFNAPHKLAKIKDYLSGYGYRISRIDIALDLPGDYCRANKLTVPSILASHVDDRMFDPISGSRAMLSSQFGDWTWCMQGRGDAVAYQDYNPAKQAPKGLTASIGSRQCANYIRVYEKAKQLISVAELGDDHDLDKWDVRIEQEIKRQKHLPPIPWDILTHPDYFFMIGRNARSYLDDYRATLSAEAIVQAQKMRFERHQALSLERKIFWGKRAYGRLVNTLLDEGLTKEEVCDKLTRNVGLKDFVYDIAAADDCDTIDIDTSCYQQDTSALAREIRRTYGLWLDHLAYVPNPAV